MATADTQQTFKIELDWKATTLALLMLPGLLWLGFWQLDRADEKRQLQALYKQRAASQPVAITELNNPEQMRYKPVFLQGQYLPQWNVLLDNKIYHGSFGYEILTAFKLNKTQQIVWVNRGWIKGDRARLSLPIITEPRAGQQRLIAELYIPQGSMLQLGEDNNKQWPRRVQTIDIDRLQQEMQQDMFPYSVRLAENSVGMLERNWMVVNIAPAKHTGYAVQWFAMAAMAVIITLLANTNLWQLWQQRKS
ncbi:MAG: cytochrome oxidase assembly protein ShyY1 [Pseudohongiellaceae bacterium]|jgi:cytochrome oxidase assembly protein ShyY1